MERPRAPPQRFRATRASPLLFRRRKIGFVFQAYNLVPVLNVYENIVLPIELDGGTVDSTIYTSTQIVDAANVDTFEADLNAQMEKAAAAAKK